ncbi:SDR family oxidoreductase [Aneurinibacillus sp. REN35]|uniref:SDR family oxidoreductase n=1 Tax=Aneurinibacillus sp. REN35 TaxID=3237286 RepID=UPI0035299EC1
MKVLVVGAHGKTGRHIVKLLAKSEQHKVRAMIREEKQTDALEKLGAEEIVFADLEKDISYAVDGCDAIIFAAGSGSQTGPDKTELVDHLGAIKMIEEGEKQAIQRYIQLSSMFADDPESGPNAIHHYLVAKQKSDERLQSSTLNYTIVRPGGLLDDHGSGRVQAEEKIKNSAVRTISREDVARTIVAALDTDHTSRRTFELLSGETPIEEALRQL